MARQITTEAVNAFMVARKNFSKDNTKVTLEQERDEENKYCTVVVMRLHGNTIAKRAVGSNEILITNAGWFSTTTKERLNGLPGVSVCQKKGVWFLNGNEWNGEWTSV